MPAEKVVERATSIPHCVARMKDADTIIWDEAGMSSKRIFQLVNAIHHEIAEEKDAKKPFGSKQLILVGEFLQLKPVPGTFDEGEFMFRSQLFRVAIPHRFELKELKRHNLADKTFITALKELRLGICSPETEALLRSLDRPLEGEAVDIFFTKISVQLHNQEALFRMPGELLTFDCVDEGNVTGISCPADIKLLLKVGAKVMIVWNLNDDVKNGTSGKFLGMREDMLEVELPNHAKVALKRQTWSKRDRTGKVVGSRTQYPVTLFYACTCHKTQGLTLPRAVVHCSKEFVSGLIYVAISRVRHPDDIQVRKFQVNQLLKPPQDALTVCDNSQEESDDLTCCVHQNLNNDLFSVCDIGEEFEEDGDAPEALSVDRYPDGLTSSYFDMDDVVDVVDLGSVFLALDEEGQCLGPPNDFDIVQLLINQRVPESVALDGDEFCKGKNEAIDKVLEDSVPQLKLLSLILWHRMFNLLRDHLETNADDVLVHTMLRKHLTDATHRIYLEVIGSAEYRRELRALFQVDVLSEAHLSIGSTLCLDTFTFFVHYLASKVDCQRETEEINFKVSEMPIEGLAKLRHVAGWAVRKELERCRRYIRDNMFSQTPETRRQVYIAYAKCELLEENLIVQYAWLQDNTSAPGTLEVTEDRQYRERGLLHITDEAFECFKVLEDLRVEQMNLARLSGTTKKADYAANVTLAIQSDETLATVWKAAFKDIEEDKEVLVDELLSGVVSRYMNMATCQFLRDFRRAYNLKKTAEHRKRVLQRRQVAAQCNEHAKFADIMADRSTGKQISHNHLHSFIQKHGVAGVKRVYNKDQLGKLCRAYGIRVITSHNKQQLSQSLVDAVSSRDSNGNIPHPHYVSHLRAQAEVNDGRILLRISRAP
ncbi:hypothetical protein ACROYT_G012571 [Oculina patagonica]